MAEANLTDKQVKAARPGQVLGDGGGLWLHVAKSGNGRSWIYRYTDPISGRVRKMPFWWTTRTITRRKLCVCTIQHIQVWHCANSWAS
ncbi:Arm DNA-binding domain-containing protein [Candidimonas humi]|uniref:Arm DNA-binding domain-containing protein n=1 Tax=Candidimonas humi TaxID=683355 RepID=A0ABV8NZW5_9BURK|nr:Arm DNA-binding domain-containing protein [Candidimonas humi]